MQGRTKVQLSKAELGKGAMTDAPTLICCAKCKADIRKKSCGCDTGWITPELNDYSSLQDE